MAFCNINQNLKKLLSNAITNKNITQVIYVFKNFHRLHRNHREIED